MKRRISGFVKFLHYSKTRNFSEKIDSIIDLNSQNLNTGVLRICPTPIGNLNDLSLRMMETLCYSDIIACEGRKIFNIDTRKTGALFKLISEKQIQNNIADAYGLNKLDLFKMTLEDQEEDESGIFHDEFDHISSHKNKAKTQERDSLEFLKNQSNEESEYNDDFVEFLRTRINKIRKKKNRGLLISYYKFNEDKRVGKLIMALKHGINVALVSDAGTPAISDPGYKLVQSCHLEGIKVEAIPGPCAVITALSASGFPTDSFIFEGYLERMKNVRNSNLEELKKGKRTIVGFESVHRLKKTLLSIEEVFGEKQIIFLAFEITKVHEKFIRKTVRELINLLSDSKFPWRGEVTLVIAPHIPEYNSNLEIKKENDSEIDNLEDDFARIDISKLTEVLYDYLDISTKELAGLLQMILKISKSKAMDYAIAIKRTKTSKEGEVNGFDEIYKTRIKEDPNC